MLMALQVDDIPSQQHAFVPSKGKRIHSLPFSDPALQGDCLSTALPTILPSDDSSSSKLTLLYTVCKEVNTNCRRKWPRNLQDQLRLSHKLITRHLNVVRFKMNLYPSGRAARNFMNQSPGTKSVYNFSNSLKTVSQTQRITSRIQGFSIKKTLLSVWSPTLIL